MALSPKKEQEAIERLRTDGKNLKRYAKQNITREMCLAAVQQNGWSLNYVPRRLRDVELCLAAVRQRGDALEFVPNELKDRVICQAAVQQDGRALQHVPKEKRDQEYARLQWRRMAGHWSMSQKNNVTVNCV